MGAIGSNFLVRLAGSLLEATDFSVGVLVLGELLLDFIDIYRSGFKAYLSIYVSHEPGRFSLAAVTWPSKFTYIKVHVY